MEIEKIKEAIGRGDEYVIGQSISPTDVLELQSLYGTKVGITYMSDDRYIISRFDFPPEPKVEKDIFDKVYEQTTKVREVFDIPKTTQWEGVMLQATELIESLPDEEQPKVIKSVIHLLVEHWRQKCADKFVQCEELSRAGKEQDSILLNWEKVKSDLEALLK